MTRSLETWILVQAEPIQNHKLRLSPFWARYYYSENHEPYEDTEGEPAPLKKPGTSPLPWAYHLQSLVSIAHFFPEGTGMLMPCQGGTSVPGIDMEVTYPCKSWYCPGGCGLLLLEIKVGLSGAPKRSGSLGDRNYKLQDSGTAPPRPPICSLLKLPEIFICLGRGGCCRRELPAPLLRPDLSLPRCGPGVHPQKNRSSCWLLANCSAGSRGAPRWGEQLAWTPFVLSLNPRSATSWVLKLLLVS